MFLQEIKVLKKLTAETQTFLDRQLWLTICSSQETLGCPSYPIIRFKLSACPPALHWKITHLYGE